MAILATSKTGIFTVKKIEEGGPEFPKGQCLYQIGNPPGAQVGCGPCDLKFAIVPISIFSNLKPMAYKPNTVVISQDAHTLAEQLAIGQKPILTSSATLSDSGTAFTPGAIQPNPNIINPVLPQAPIATPVAPSATITSSTGVIDTKHLGKVTTAIVVVAIIIVLIAIFI